MRQRRDLAPLRALIAGESDADAGGGPGPPNLLHAAGECRRLVRTGRHHLGAFPWATEGAVAANVNLRKKILIADDHEMLRRGLRNTLQRERDLEICGEAVDGEEAVEKTKTLQPDLVILDINMPGLNGLAALRQILRHRPKTKVLVFSVHDSDQTIQEANAAGAHGFLSKGKDAQDLLRVIREILNANCLPASAAN